MLHRPDIISKTQFRLSISRRHLVTNTAAPVDEVGRFNQLAGGWIVASIAQRRESTVLPIPLLQAKTNATAKLISHAFRIEFADDFAVGGYQHLRRPGRFVICLRKHFRRRNNWQPFPQFSSMCPAMQQHPENRFENLNRLSQQINSYSTADAICKREARSIENLTPFDHRLFSYCCRRRISASTTTSTLNGQLDDNQHTDAHDSTAFVRKGPSWGKEFCPIKLELKSYSKSMVPSESADHLKDNAMKWPT